RRRRAARRQDRDHRRSRRVLVRPVAGRAVHAHGLASRLSRRDLRPAAAGQKLDRLSLPIARGGVITGAVVDDVGDPAFGAQVRALRYVLRTGVRTLQVAGQGSTDDRGVYRIPALPPGEYLVVTSAREAGLVVEEMKMREELLTAAVARLAAAGDPSSQMKEAALKDAMGSVASPADRPMYAPVYYPGTTQPKSASTVTLDV